MPFKIDQDANYSIFLFKGYKDVFTAETNSKKVYKIKEKWQLSLPITSSYFCLEVMTVSEKSSGPFSVANLFLQMAYFHIKDLGWLILCVNLAGP